MDSFAIAQLYENVLVSDIYKYNISEEDVRIGIESMRDVYKPDMLNLCSLRSNVADYNDPAHRCAYLHKYAAFHTAMVRDFFYDVLSANHRLFYEQIFSHGPYSVCCLGGGPGNDVIAVLSAFHNIYSYFPVSATIVDYMENWKYSFHSILSELGSGRYGAFGSNTHHFLDWRYLQANLLKPLAPHVEDIIRMASLVTMVKFVSATACQNTEDMINNVFSLMKPGAAILFIDNDGGGFHQIVTRASLKWNFMSLYGPLRHQEYINLDVKNKRFGFVSCNRTVLTIHVLMKPRLKELYPSCRNYFSEFSNYAYFDHRLPRKICRENALTPLIYVAGSNVRNQFSLPDEELLQSPGSMVSYVATPPNTSLVNSPELATPLNASLVNSPELTTSENTPKRKHGKRKAVGCLPMNRWRHHVAQRLNQVKSRAKKLLLKKGPKKHPVFRL